MDDTLVGMLLGALVGGGLVIIVVGAVADTYQRKCAKKHNVFACEVVWVPVAPGATP
jgi:hypothetical protein